MKETFRFKVPEAEHRKRLDEFLFDRFGSLSKMHLRGLLANNQVQVNGNSEKPGYHLRKDDEIKIEVDLSKGTSMTPQPIPLEIIFEDEEIIVVNKPAEMLVHPTLGVKTGTLLNALSFHLNKSSQTDVKSQEAEAKDAPSENPASAVFIRPGLIHRLDKQTSGLMVIAKTKRAHKILSNHFKRKLVEKKYFALVEGNVKEDSGTIDAPVGSNETLKRWEVREDGKAAETRFQVLRRFENSTILELEPVTGRTNQLRVHCEFLGYPILGDTDRGGREFPRLCLHAYKLSFWHPNGKERLELISNLPKEFLNVDA